VKTDALSYRNFTNRHGMQNSVRHASGFWHCMHVEASSHHVESTSHANNTCNNQKVQRSMLASMLRAANGRTALNNCQAKAPWPTGQQRIAGAQLASCMMLSFAQIRYLTSSACGYYPQSLKQRLDKTPPADCPMSCM
jgi:hypothetical protein